MCAQQPIMPHGWIDIALKELGPWLLIGGALVALAVVVLLVTLIFRTPKSKSQATHITPAQQRMLERDVSNLISALSEMAQDVGTRLDERALRLEKLIYAADERLARLEALSKNANGRDALDEAPVIAAQEAVDHADPRHVEIYALADKGLMPIDIAKHLSRPKGEVELILALRPRRAG
jgi:hypothetical protein